MRVAVVASIISSFLQATQQLVFGSHGTTPRGDDGKLTKGQRATRDPTLISKSLKHLNAPQYLCVLQESKKFKTCQSTQFRDAWKKKF